MLARLSIVAGLLVGVVVAAVALGGIVALGPVAPLPTIAGPSLALPSTVPSAAPSGSPSAVPSASPAASGGAFHNAANGLVIIAVDVREDEGAVASFAQQLNATFPLGLDADGKAATTRDALALPVHFWIGADGIIRDGALGGIGPDVMAAGLKTILPGVNVTP